MLLRYTLLVKLLVAAACAWGAAARPNNSLSSSAFSHSSASSSHSASNSASHEYLPSFALPLEEAEIVELDLLPKPIVHLPPARPEDTVALLPPAGSSFSVENSSDSLSSPRDTMVAVVTGTSKFIAPIDAKGDPVLVMLRHVWDSVQSTLAEQQRKHFYPPATVSFGRNLIKQLDIVKEMSYRRLQKRPQVPGASRKTANHQRKHIAKQQQHFY